MSLRDGEFDISMLSIMKTSEEIWQDVCGGLLGPYCL